MKITKIRDLPLQEWRNRDGQPQMLTGWTIVSGDTYGAASLRDLMTKLMALSENLWDAEYELEGYDDYGTTMVELKVRGWVNVEDWQVADAQRAVREQKKSRTQMQLDTDRRLLEQIKDRSPELFDG